MKYVRKITILIFAGIAAACNHGEKKSHQHHDHHDHTGSAEGHAHHSAIPHGEPTDMSLYHLTSQWRTQTGTSVTLQDLAGKVRVISMVYTTCQYACPRIVADLKHIQSSLSKHGADKTHFVLVSIDPEVDTVGRLQVFANEQGMSADKWTLLNGTEGDVLELAALLGVKYKKTSATDYAHSNIISVLNQQGEIAYQQTGLGSDPSHTVNVIENLTAKD